MCYLVRQHLTEAERGETTPAPTLQRFPRRWAMAGAAMFIGGLAVAAVLVVPSSTPPVSAAVAAPLPITPISLALPAADVVGRSPVAPVDDGVPTTSDVAKAGMGGCEHGL